MAAGEAPGRAEFLIVARVRRSHGVRGEVLVSIDTDRPKQIFRPGRRLLVGDLDANPSGRSVVVGGIRPATGGAILRFEEVRTRDEADTFRGHSLLIPAEEAPPAAADEVHYRELVGLTARCEGRSLGSVVDIMDVAGRELLVVRGEKGREILVPLVPEIVREVDLAAGELRLELPEGFLEI